ncbi:hypothetical protein F4777DRAFT_575165 [Nemania sp. FL0916]|nr:hypothetical protein F4777DRAFT_575165 [Nemania sp. FL0916]
MNPVLIIRDHLLTIQVHPIIRDHLLAIRDRLLIRDHLLAIRDHLPAIHAHLLTIRVHLPPGVDDEEDGHSVIVRAREQAIKDHEYLGVTINIVLLHEWCEMAPSVFHTIPESFKTAMEILPVQYGKRGYIPFDDPQNEWGIKTNYDPELSTTYIPTLLIEVPAILPEVAVNKQEKLKATYKRFVTEPRSERLEGVRAIPFRDTPRFKRYAIFFKFESGNTASLLFEKYVPEKEIIRVHKPKHGRKHKH